MCIFYIPGSPVQIACERARAHWNEKDIYVIVPHAHGKWASSEWFISEVCQMKMRRVYGLVLVSSAVRRRAIWNENTKRNIHKKVE